MTEFHGMCPIKNHWGIYIGGRRAPHYQPSSFRNLAQAHAWMYAHLAAEWTAGGDKDPDLEDLRENYSLWEIFRGVAAIGAAHSYGVRKGWYVHLRDQAHNVGRWDMSPDVQTVSAIGDKVLEELGWVVRSAAMAGPGAEWRRGALGTLGRAVDLVRRQFGVPTRRLPEFIAASAPTGGDIDVGDDAPPECQQFRPRNVTTPHELRGGDANRGATTIPPSIGAG